MNDTAIVFDIEKFATHDGPGIRTVVFLKGCPLRCMWCHSPESWSPQPERYPDGTAIGRPMTAEEVMEEVLEDKDFYEASGGGLTVSGGEPLARWEFVVGLFRKAKAAGLHCVIETCGYAAPHVVEAVAAETDLWLFDIKGLDAEKHLEQTRVDNKPILKNLRWLDAQGAQIVLRCPMVPGVNDFASNLEALGRLADGLKNVERIDVASYVPFGVDKARKLGLKTYEAPMPAADYADGIVRTLSGLTRKPVRKG